MTRAIDTHRWHQSLYDALDRIHVGYYKHPHIKGKVFAAEVYYPSKPGFVMEFATPYPSTQRKRFSGISKDHKAALQNKIDLCKELQIPLLLLRRGHNALELQMEIQKFIGRLEQGKAEPVEGPAPFKRHKRVTKRQVAMMRQSEAEAESRDFLHQLEEPTD